MATTAPNSEPPGASSLTLGVLIGLRHGKRNIKIQELGQQEEPSSFLLRYFDLSVTQAQPPYLQA